MESIRQNKVIAHTSAYLPEGVIAITTMFIYALKWTLLNTIERYKARWVVRGFLEIPDVHFNPDATHAPVAADSSPQSFLTTSNHGGCFGGWYDHSLLKVHPPASMAV